MGSTELLLIIICNDILSLDKQCVSGAWPCQPIYIYSRVPLCWIVVWLLGLLRMRVVAHDRYSREIRHRACGGGYWISERGGSGELLSTY